MTRRQIGEALEYENPQIAISKIHNAHKERLDRFSTVSVLDKVEGGREVPLMEETVGLLDECGEWD